MKDSSAAIINRSLEKEFEVHWSLSRVIFFTAPCGCGKTTTAKALLAGFSIWETDSSSTDFTACCVPANCTVVLIDDLHRLTEAAQQQALCELIRSRAELHFVLLSRGRLPGWLMPFQFAGVLWPVETETLMLDRDATARMLESRGVEMPPALITAVWQELKGYPAAVELLCRRLIQTGETYSKSTYDALVRDLFAYYDEAVYRRFPEPLRRLLIGVAPFDGFTLELARLTSGDSRSGEWLGLIHRDTTMLLYDGAEQYRVRPIFRRFLLWELQQVMPEEEQRQLYSRAALYYELREELDKALEFYTRAGEQKKVTALLIKNAERHPGLGHYRELQSYYYALPQSEALRSPTLICAMSMLTALCLDYESSERWYCELQSYAARLGKTDFEYREVRTKLAYLDIALPQRGSKRLVELLGEAFRAAKEKHLDLPQFSVTGLMPSVVNGGKDLCEWSKQDDLLYATMCRPVEAMLGRQGVGLADCALCESKFEKGEDVSKRLLTLVSRMGEIQSRGTADTEFAVAGLLARVQVSQGRAASAKEAVVSLRQKFAETGQTRFLGNLDALLCRIALRQGNIAEAGRWLAETAPKNEARLWAMWRYQYLTRAMVQFAEQQYDEALLLLARLTPYCVRCHRTLDLIGIQVLSALCMERKGDEDWRTMLCIALDSCHEYGFLWPVAQYGAAVLGLLAGCGWQEDETFFCRMVAAARIQAIQYPRFLRRQKLPVEQLSAAEMQVLKLLCEDLSNQEIGELLNIKLATVKSHVSHILQKLGVGRRAEAKTAAEQLRLI